MAHPGRPRGRMNKKTLQAQAASQAEQLARVQQQQAQQQAQRAAQAQMGNNPNSQQSIKEETGVQLHDEADLISFRNDALLRYITNHEYIENVMSKLIHSSKIIPPSLYPLIPKINEYENLKPEDVYFGDLEAMKYVEKKLAERSDNMKGESDPSYVKYLFNDEKYQYQRASMAKLSELQNDLHDKDSLNKLESELDNMLNEYKTKFNQEYNKKPAVSKYSITIDKISSQIEVTSAPADYNPKLISSFINMNNNSTRESLDNMNSDNNESGNFNNEGLNGFQFNGNIDTSKFNGFSGIPMNQFDNNFGLSMNDSNDNSTNNENNVDTNSSVPPQDTGSGEDVNMSASNSTSQINTNASNNDLNSSTSNTNNSDNESNTNISAEQDDGEDQVMEDVGSKDDKDGQDQEHQQKPEEISNETNNDNISSKNIEENIKENNEHDANSNDSNQANTNDLDMNDFFNDKGDGDMNHLGMVDDDIGDLYNFETGGEDDNGLIGGSEFELDFLSHIDHGME